MRPRRRAGDLIFRVDVGLFLFIVLFGSFMLLMGCAKPEPKEVYRHTEDLDVYRVVNSSTKINPVEVFYAQKKRQT